MLFPPSAIQSKAPDLLTPRCGSCGLYKGCKSPKMEPTGEGREKVLVVAEAPGEKEDDEGTQLIGKTGKRLRVEMKKLEWDLDRDCWKMNAVICRPPDNKTTDKHVIACRANLNRTIADLKPEVILLLGASAVKSLIGQEWRESVGKIGQWVGWRIPSQRLNAWVCPTWHPSYLNRENDKRLDLLFHNHLSAALELEGRPWKKLPDWSKQVQCVRDTDEAARVIRAESYKREGPIAFDYETNMLKPDNEKARIVCCAVCWEGGYTIAFPWHGKAVEATGELLRSGVGKIAANMKFEERWTRKVLGHGVKNWVWDTMVNSHILDNRPGITGLKFQAYAVLGQSPWDETVAPYLKASGGNVLNRIDEVELGDLLQYCGMDALIEWKLYEKQREKVG